MNMRDNRFRLQQWHLAERQRYLGELESLAARLRGDAERLGDEIAAVDPQTFVDDRTVVYRLFIRPLIERRDKLNRSISTLDAQIAETRDAVAGAQREMRSYSEGGVHLASLPLHQRRQRRRA